MKPFLMGAETEYAVSGRKGAVPLATRDVHSLLFKAIQKERRWLSDVIGGEALYLENGGRFYLDYGCHPEYATPECFTPHQLAVYDKAGERLLDLARRRVEEERPGTKLTILKNNLNLIWPDEITWGTHESYTSWVEPNRAAVALLPHMVSRTIYAGSGCLSAYEGGMGFELSQRARHIQTAVSADTTADRPLFCTRLRKVSDGSTSRGWIRAHLISKDSQRAPLGIYLTHGVTALLFLLLNEGHTLGHGLAIVDPVQALREVSSDPWLRTRVQLLDGRRLTALEIQQSYLEECERLLPDSGLPEWTGEVVRHWGETLATLAKDPLRMARKLDPYYKLLVFDHELGRAGCGWSELKLALQTLAALRLEYTSKVLEAILAQDTHRLNEDENGRFTDAVARYGPFDGDKLDQMRLAVRLEQMDLLYHEVGGLYDQQSASGHLESGAVSREDVERATREAPVGGRAAVRSELIRQMRDAGWLCEWRYLYHEDTGEFVDLRNPFGNSFQPCTWTRLLTDQANDPDVQEIAAQISRRQ